MNLAVPVLLNSRDNQTGANHAVMASDQRTNGSIVLIVPSGL